MKAPKVKLKLDGKAIQQWFISHAEKLLFGVFALVMAYYVYGAATRETFDKAPTDLQAAVTRAKQTIDGGNQNVADRLKTSGIVFSPYSEKVVPRDAFVDFPQIPKEWHPEVVPRDRRRGTPKLFPPRDLEIAADYGAMRWRGTGGESPTRGFSWIVVTGLVEYAEQVDEYMKSFMLADTRGPSDNEPVYEQVIVQRAEVKTDDPNEPFDWTQIWPRPKPPRGLIPSANWLAQNKWEGTAADLVPQEFLLPNVTDPLGPLVDKSWTSAVVHSKFPLPRVEAAAAPVASDTEATGEDPSDEMDFQQAEEMPADGVEQDAAAEAPPAAATAPKPAPVAPKPTPPPGGGGLRMNFGGAAAAPAGAPAPQVAAAAPVAVDAIDPEKLEAARPYRLLRFFDFTAQVGKRYRYRVKLVVQNPNYDLSEIACKPDTNTTDLTLASDFSEPSPVASVPRFNNVLVGGVKLTRGEPLVTAIVRQFDVRTGLERFIERNEKSKSQMLIRGQLANFRELVKQGGKETTIDFAANTMLADAFGGETLNYAGNKTTVPAVTAWFDDTGQLVVQTETHDHPAYRDASKKLGLMPSTGDGSSATPVVDAPPPGAGSLRMNFGGKK